MIHKKLIFNTLFILIFLIPFSLSLKAQNIDYEKLSLDEIEESFAKINNNVTGEKVAKIYISRAKKEKNIEALFRAYKLACYYTERPKNLEYVDSTLLIAKRINKTNFLIQAYLCSGNIKDMNNNASDGIKDLLIAYNYSKETDDEYLKNKILYNISQYEIYIGNYFDSKKRLSLVNQFFKENFNKKGVGKDYPMLYFYTASLLCFVNTKLGNVSENISLYKEAYKRINLNKTYEAYRAYFVSSEGIDAYYNKNYPLAISKLNQAINEYNDNYTHITEIYYLGLSYWQLNQKDKAVDYFLKLDKEKYKDKNQDPQYRPAYELLIQYYKEKRNTNKQLEYINKLLYLDRSYEKNYKYLFSKISKEYTSEKLIQEKKEIENSLKIHRLLIVFIVILSFSILSFVFYRYTIVQRTYKQRFREILAEKTRFPAQENIENTIANIKIESKKPVLYSKIPGLSASTIDSILSKLDALEKDFFFLNSQITQKSLSDELGTNPSYLSKIINAYKEKSFTQYINDLRLDFMLEKLKTEEKYLTTDIKEIASMAGFNSAESFSDNFQRKFKIKPSYFIKMMKENISSNNL